MVDMTGLRHTISRVIKSAVYTSQAERTDGNYRVLGGVTYIQFEDCEHVMLEKRLWHGLIASLSAAAALVCAYDAGHSHGLWRCCLLLSMIFWILWLFRYLMRVVSR